MKKLEYMSKKELIALVNELSSKLLDKQREVSVHRQRLLELSVQVDQMLKY